MNQSDAELREEALQQLKKKAEFKMHLFTYVVINALIVGVWLMTGSGFFWPIFPIVGWGIGLAFHAYDVYNGPPSEGDVQREMDRLRRAR